MKKKAIGRFGLILSLLLMSSSFMVMGCQSKGGGIGASDAASQVYVRPGTHDKFYAFLSGGFNGQLLVYGLPSTRLLKMIPVFTVGAENGYGHSEETKALLNTSFGFIPWGDSHHPQLSKTHGVPDGRWVFINENNTPRIARINLKTFETEEIIEIPNSGGNHPSPFITQDSEYLLAGTRFSVPIPNVDTPYKDYKEKFKGTMSFIRADKPGKMEVEFQILLPGFDYDIARAGKGPSHGWFFVSCYNTEQSPTWKERNASKNDKDYIAAINWKKAKGCVAAGKAKNMPATYYHNYMDPGSRIAKSVKKTSVKVLSPDDCPGIVYYLPTPKSPHGVNVDPTGEYIVGSGKLSAAFTVHSFSKMIKAIENKAFSKTVYGIPVIKYEAVMAGEVQGGMKKPVCLGPLHTEFDGKGYAYTSCFLSNNVIKWKLGEWKVVDQIRTYYNIGHLMIPGGDSSKPFGKYLIAMNKTTKDRFLPTGPELAHAGQLIDISGEKMKLLSEFPELGEPHYAQALPAELVEPNSLRIYKLKENTHPHAVKSEKEALAKGKNGVVRDGNTVHIYLTTIRSHFKPDNIEGVKMGDTVYFHVTNLEQDWDVPHGFAIMGNQNVELLIMPGETRSTKWIPQKAGVYPFYCTDFCSALHQEMQGYVRVSG